MIDGLIDHLEKSREKLTHDEIKAAEDFAKFQHHTRVENAHLKRTIIILTKQIAELREQLKVAKVQLVKREKLRDQAKAALEHLIKICNEKKVYYEHETKRRNHEIACVNTAIKIFDGALAKLSARIRARANANIAGRKYKAKNVLTGHVKKGKAELHKNLVTRKTHRNKVVFF